MVDNDTLREIDISVMRVLRDAGLRKPPIRVEPLLEHLKVDRGFYDLEDPSLLRSCWHKVKVKGHKLKNIIKNIKLAALWLPDQERILVDSSLPPPKQEWASFHDATHSILVWHREFFLGDTAQTLDPDFQMQLEAEANYGASALMFGGKVFTQEALDTTPRWESIELLKKRYDKSYPTTLRRYVQFSHNIPMALMVSTPWWTTKPEDQEFQWRHFIRSKRFIEYFHSITPYEILDEINQNTVKRRGGPVGDFGFYLKDNNGDLHEFFAQSFFNQHYLLNLIVHRKKITAKTMTL
jgi:Zn-dependent peptidase ImmA (M78 family)